MHGLIHVHGFQCDDKSFQREANLDPVNPTNTCLLGIIHAIAKRIGHEIEHANTVELDGTP